MQYGYINVFCFSLQSKLYQNGNGGKKKSRYPHEVAWFPESCDSAVLFMFNSLHKNKEWHSWEQEVALFCLVPRSPGEAPVLWSWFYTMANVCSSNVTWCIEGLIDFWLLARVAQRRGYKTLDAFFRGVWMQTRESVKSVSPSEMRIR